MEEGFHCIKGCIRCCTDRGNPLELTVGDIIRLCEYLSISTKHLFKHYCEIIWNRIPDTSLLIPSIGLIFPCRFLNGDKCTVYDFRPIHCRLFPEALIVENADLSLYRSCGYQCINEGIFVNENKEPYIHELKKTDSVELENTESYFENFKYCFKLKPEESERISRQLSKVDNTEKAEKKRELCTKAISKGTRDKVLSIFMEKLDRLDRKIREKGFLSVMIALCEKERNYNA